MKSLGIVGTGQLGWMMILEGRKLNIEFSVIGSDPEAPASRIADKFYYNKEYREFVDHCDIVTPEFEHVDRQILEYAEMQGKLFPNTKALDLKLSCTYYSQRFHNLSFSTELVCSCMYATSLDLMS